MATQTLNARAKTIPSPIGLVADTIDTHVCNLYNVKAVFEGLRALGQRLEQQGEDDSIAPLALVGQEALQDVIDCLVPLSDTLKRIEQSGVHHG